MKFDDFPPAYQAVIDELKKLNATLEEVLKQQGTPPRSMDYAPAKETAVVNTRKR